MESPSTDTHDEAIQRRPLLRLFLRYKKRLAFLVLIGGLLVIGNEIGSAYPREVQLIYEVEGAADTLHLEYHRDGGAVAGATVRNPPERTPHDVQLSPGRYDIQAVIESGTQSRRYQRALVVPAEGIVHIRLPLEGE